MSEGEVDLSMRVSDTAYIDASRLRRDYLDQAISAKRNSFVNRDHGEIFDRVFDGKDSMRIARSDVISAFQDDVILGLLKAFIWGFPSGGRGSIASSLAIHASEFSKIVSEIRNGELQQHSFSELGNFKGINFATYTKFLYFCGAKLDGKRCLIFDSRVKSFIGKYRPSQFERMFSRFATGAYGIEFEFYRAYVNAMHLVAEQIGCDAESIELYFFENSPSRKRKSNYT